MVIILPEIEKEMEELREERRVERKGAWEPNDAVTARRAVFVWEHKDNFRHLSRFLDFFVTFRILSYSQLYLHHLQSISLFF